MTDFAGYARGTLVNWYSEFTKCWYQGRVIESDENMTLVESSFTGWIETERLELASRVGVLS